jgi:hypothetical protein
MNISLCCLFINNSVAMKSPPLKFGFRAILNTPLISNDFYSYHNETWLAAATHRLHSAADGRAVMKEMCLMDWSIAGLREGHLRDGNLGTGIETIFYSWMTSVPDLN